MENSRTMGDQEETVRGQERTAFIDRSEEHIVPGRLLLEAESGLLLLLLWEAKARLLLLRETEARLLLLLHATEASHAASGHAAKATARHAAESALHSAAGHAAESASCHRRPAAHRHPLLLLLVSRDV